MPITVVKPKNAKELKKNVKATPPGQEGDIIDLVAADFKMGGVAGYEPAADDQKFITLKGKCLVYCITGKCSVGHPSPSEGKDVWIWTPISKGDDGWMVEKEESLYLEKFAAVVIIYPKQDQLSTTQ